MTSRNAVAVSVLLLALAAIPAQAQKTARDVTPAEPVASDPHLTTAAFGDWVLRCVRAPETAKRICEVSQSLMMEGGQGPVAQIALGRRADDQPLLLTTVLPNNVSFPSTVRLLVRENDPEPLQLAFTRCVPGACMAQLTLDDASLSRLTARDAGGQLGFRDANGKDVLLPISLRGLAQAVEALSQSASGD